MDKIKSQSLQKILEHQQLNGYTIVRLLGLGKSAAVFESVDAGGKRCAIKIFDNDLIDRFGIEIQEKRIKQEIALRNHGISNLVQIMAGGKATIGAGEYYYIQMEMVEGKNLKEFIEQEEYDEDFIRQTVCILLQVSNSLLEKSIAHRDIKPENIMVKPDRQIVLMDLGVIKIIGSPSFSDEDEKQFVGTLRYAAPEFLRRQEEDSLQGWKALNLYQIGAVMHDLITKKELFADVAPYSNLVIAIKEDPPTIINERISHACVQLCRDLLVKEWKTRLALNDDEKVFRYVQQTAPQEGTLEKDLDDLASMNAPLQSRHEEIFNLERSNRAKRIKRNEIADNLRQVVVNAMTLLRNKGVFSNIIMEEDFMLTEDNALLSSFHVNNRMFVLQASLVKGYHKPLHLVVRSLIDENGYAELSIHAFFPGQSIKSNVLPLEILKQVQQELQKKYPSTNDHRHEMKFYDLFKGSVGWDDAFANHVTSGILRLIMTALKKARHWVELELEVKAKVAMGERVIPYTEKPDTIIISEPDE